jgi:uncharacterized membrane protein YgaE (UPF0421/DUF939 family)
VRIKINSIGIFMLVVMVTFLLSNIHIDVNQMFSNLVIHMLTNSVRFLTDLITVLSHTNPSTETWPIETFLNTNFTMHKITFGYRSPNFNQYSVVG